MVMLANHQPEHIGGSWLRSMAALGDRFRCVLSYGQPGPPRGQAALDEAKGFTELLRR
jgi:hypothetical protein